MKIHYFRHMILATLLLLLASGSAMSASFDLRFTVITNDQVNYEVMVEMKASSAFALSDANFVFTYNSSALTYTSFSPQNFSGDPYLAMNKTGNAGTVSLNIEWGAVNPATSVTTGWMDVASILFSVIDVAGSSQLTWDGSGTNAFDDAYALQSDGTLENLDSTLPVELSSFTAENLNGLVEIKWITESEKDNIGFNIYRASDLKSKFVKINGEMIKGAGNSSTTLIYKFVDNRLENSQTYFYKLEDVNVEGRRAFHGPIEVAVIEVTPPDDYYVQQNFPNPFNPSTKIYYGLPEAARVKLQVFNLRGELVRSLVNEEQQAGHLLVSWDGLSDTGVRMPSGVYIYRMEAGIFRQVKKMLFAK